MQLTLEFHGGLEELLCNNSKKVLNENPQVKEPKVKVLNENPQVKEPKVKVLNVNPQVKEPKFTMKHLLSWVHDNLIKNKHEMLMKGDTVRPGVLVLINDCDWELSGQLDTLLEEKDVVVFISTLHGG